MPQRQKGSPNPATARLNSAISRIMNDPVASPAGLAQQELTASVQALALPKGLYAFSVKSADPKPVVELGGLMLRRFISESVRVFRRAPSNFCPAATKGAPGCMPRA